MGYTTQNMIEGELEMLKRNEVSSQERFEMFLDLLQREYLEALNRIEAVYPWKEKEAVPQEVAEVVKEIGEEMNFNVRAALRYIDIKVPELAERVSEHVKKEGGGLEKNAPSLEDVLGNSLANGPRALLDLLELKLRTPDSRFNQLDEESREKKIEFTTMLVKKIFADYWRKGSDMRFYFDALCEEKDHEERLHFELGDQYGYIRAFENYFKSNASNVKSKLLPTGGNKIPFFRFFCDWEDGKILNLEDLERRLNEIDPRGEYVNIDKIKHDFETDNIDKQVTKQEDL